MYINKENIIIACILFFVYLYKKKDASLKEKYSGIKWNIGHVMLVLLILNFIRPALYQIFGNVPSYLFSILKNVILIYLCLHIVIFTCKQKISNLGLTWANLKDNLLLSIPSVLFQETLSLFFILAALFYFSDIPFKGTDSAPAFLNTGLNPSHVIYFCYLCIIVPISEEIFYRGFFYSALKKIVDLRFAVIFSSLFFAFAHGGLWNSKVWLVFIGAILSCVMYEVTRSLVIPIILHMVTNIGSIATNWIAESFFNVDGLEYRILIILGVTATALFFILRKGIYKYKAKYNS